MSVPERGEFLADIKFYYLHFTFETQGLLNGIVIFTPRVGDVIMPFGWISVNTAFNGTTPTAWLLPQGYASDADAVGGGAGGALLTNANAAGSHFSVPFNGNAPWPFIYALTLDTNPLVFRVDDGSGGNPVSTQGEATATICVGTSR